MKPEKKYHNFIVLSAIITVLAWLDMLFFNLIGMFLPFVLMFFAALGLRGLYKIDSEDELGIKRGYFYVFSFFTFIITFIVGFATMCKDLR